jgi:hypothetical protein
MPIVSFSIPGVVPPSVGIAKAKNFPGHQSFSFQFSDSDFLNILDTLAMAVNALDVCLNSSF